MSSGLITTVPWPGVVVDVTVNVPVPAVSFDSTVTETGVPAGVVPLSFTATGGWPVTVMFTVAVALLFVSDLSKWVLLAFPIWVLVVSVMILARSHHWVAAAGTAR